MLTGGAVSGYYDIRSLSGCQGPGKEVKGRRYLQFHSLLSLA